jgi:hypothetical protein
MTADQNTSPSPRLLTLPSFAQATRSNRATEISCLARLCDVVEIRRLGKASGYDPVTMTHSAEPDDEEPHRSVGYAPILARAATLAPTVISVVALGIAIWALTSRRSDTPPAPTAQQVAEAKTRACDAYGRARSAVALQTRTEVGTDPTAAQAVAANARLAMAVGSQHIVDNLSPAVPPELAGLLRSVATDLQDLTINALAGTTDGDTGQVTRLQDLEATSTKIVDLCK